MDPDEYQRAWRAQSSRTRVTIDADLLLKKVQRSQQDLRAATFLGDFGVIGILLLLLAVWIYMGVRGALPWTWYLMVPADIWIIGFILAGRARQKRKPSEPGEPLLKSVKESLALVEHQIWLWRNNLWWYLLPTLIPMLIFFAHVAWQLGIATNDWLVALAFGTFLFIFALAVYASVYHTIQRSVRKHHEPRRQELLALLSSLSDETASEVSGEYPILMIEKCIAYTPRRIWVGLLCFWTIMLLVIAFTLMVFHLAARIGAITNSSYDGAPRRSVPASESLAQLIESAQMHWSDTIGQIFPEASVHGGMSATPLRGRWAPTSTSACRPRSSIASPTRCRRRRRRPTRRSSDCVVSPRPFFGRTAPRVGLIGRSDSGLDRGFLMDERWGRPGADPLRACERAWRTHSRRDARAQGPRAQRTFPA
jgi:hypothetical protein